MLQRSSLRSVRVSAERGFTMVEVVIASALLGFSLIVMFGFHGQALRANMNARRLTDCTYLAQTQMERLLSMDWSSAARPTDLTNSGTVDAGAVDMYADLEWPGTGAEINALNNGTAAFLTPTLYTVTWDVEDMDSSATWVRLRVRCTYDDSTFGTSQGTTVSSYRFKDS